MKNITKSERFFTEEERKKIKETTKDVELRTIGEIAVMVVDSSAEYFHAEIIGGIILGSFISFIITVLYFEASVWSYIPLGFLFFFPSWFLFKKLPSLKTAFMSVKRKEEAVRLRAVRAFYEKGLHRTRKNTGVLFFLSLLERKVWVLADQGIYEKIQQETLNKFAMSVSQGISAGRACDTLCESIKEAGELLAKHFPITPGDIDELTDEVMSE
jgi:putative membrane protein